MIESCCRRLHERGDQLAAAESMTAGMLMARFALSHHVSGVLLGGIVCYDASVKQQLLQVPQTLIDEYTPESAEVTRSITENLAIHFPHARVRVGITGLARAGGSESPEKPVGTVFFHVIAPEGEWAIRKQFMGNDQEIIEAAIVHLAQFLLDHLPPDL